MQTNNRAFQQRPADPIMQDNGLNQVVEYLEAQLHLP
jgi:hypothetical protein